MKSYIWFIREVKKSKKLHYVTLDGFVSIYFMMILLLVTSQISVVSAIYQYRFETITNLKQNEKYMECEGVILQNLKCDLLRGINEDEILEDAGIRWSQTFSNSVIYVTVHDPIREEMTIEFDQETRMIVSYSCNRYEEN